MARAPNPGAPQRVSAHVLPKAPSFSADDDEKTTIESGGWEEEASTTVEQGEVADKVRALGLEPAARSNTAITSTDGNGVSDEPTVDDQRASVALSMLPPPSVARLVVTRGSDTGRLLEVRPGKTYTIGRGIDNDLVLTDITASRKHFDLRHDNGSWILADRGSGNGTAVNDRIEDAPFMLASGDAIEVGNTVFRFDLVTTAISLPGLPRELPARGAPAAAHGRAGASTNGRPGGPGDASDSSNMPTPSDMPLPRELVAPSALDSAAPDMRTAREARELVNGIPHEVPSLVPTYDGSVDDDLELSTVSGKPLHDQEVAPTPVVTQSRPKTLPPPAPLPRPRTQTGRPPVGYALDRAGPRSQSMAVVPQPQLAPSALAAMAPTISPAMAPTISPAMAPTISPMHGAPMLPQPATTLPLPQMANRPPLSPALLDPPLSSLPATIPGQGPPVLARGPRLLFSYPGAQEIPPHTATGSRPPGQHGHPGRDATSTALVQPISYSGRQVAMAPPPAPIGVPPLSRRTKLALGAIGLTVFAAIAAIAIVRGVSGNPASVDKTAPPPSPVTREPTVPPIKPPTVTPIQPAPGSGPGASRVDRPSPPATPRTADKTAPTAPVATGPGATPAPGTAPAAASDKAASTAAPPGAASSGTPLPDKVAVASTPPGAASPGAPLPAMPPAGGSPGPAPAGAQPAAPPRPPASAGNAPPPGPATAPAPRPASGTTAATPRTTDKASAEPSATGPRNDKGTPIEPNATGSPRNDRPDRNDRRTTKHAETRRTARAEPAAPPARTEKKHTGRSTQEIRAEASALYKNKNFSGAAALLTSSLSGYSNEDAKDLRTIAGIYSQLGKAYNVGMAPGTKPTEAYLALRRGIDFDHDVGSAYVSEMQRRLVDTASRAASYYMADHQYELAFQAVRTSEALGSTSKNNATVRRMLEETASDLYRDGASELSGDPEGAKKKLHQILGIVESKHPLYIKAQKLLNGP